MGRSIHRSGYRRATVVFVALLALAGAVVPLGAQERGTPVDVPVVPPWRQELIPRERPLTVVVGQTAIQVEVANDDVNQRLGLGYRDGLPPNTGMLFVFDEEPTIRNFWMGPMRFCLDIIWIDEGAITGAAQKTCPGPYGGPDNLVPRHTSPGPAEFVLEVPAGFLEEHGYGVGTPITFSEDPYSIPEPDQS